MVRKDKKKDKEKDQERSLCQCLYETLIHLNTKCVYISPENPSITHVNYTDKLRECVMAGISIADISPKEFMSIFDETYCRLVVLTNERMMIDDVILHRVHKIIFHNCIIDANIIRDKASITIWSNCISDINLSTYYIYWKGILIGRDNCPPDLDYIQNMVIHHPDVVDVDIYSIDCMIYTDDIYIEGL